MKEKLEHLRDASRRVVRAGGVLGVGRRVDVRAPVHVRVGLRIPVGVSELDGGDGPPEHEVPLAVPGGDARVHQRQVGEGEEPGTLGDVRDVRVGDVAERLVVHREEVHVEERREVGLLLGAVAVDVSAQAFDLLVVLRVIAAVQRRRPLVRAKLIRTLNHERPHEGEPLRGHRSATRRRRRKILGHRTPFAGVGSADERGRRGIGEAPVPGPHRDESGRGRRADRNAGVGLRDEVGGEIGVIRRVEKRELGRELVDQHVVRRLRGGRGRGAGRPRNRGGVRLVLALDRLNRVVHGGADHRPIDDGRRAGPGRRGRGEHRLSGDVVLPACG